MKFKAIAISLLTVALHANAQDLIRKITHQEVMQHVAANKKLVFIDSREPDEWEEERIPAALNLPLRHVRSSDALRSVPKDAVVIAYCIKDFRGYEVARALKRERYDVYVMDDPGLQGWKKAKLPTAGQLPRLTDLQAGLILSQRSGNDAK
ncbi:MAG TPA: rhodanese-like domain-containing protein [Burkholderiaceae bacterium]|nr:rhodanese-like domain-containing protein [Burkholderiaceae bacterium]